MTKPSTALECAIDQAYTAFLPVPRPVRLVASPLRNADEILAELSAAPLRELSSEQVGPYSSWAITTVGNGRDYQHFLPRIFELSIADPVWLGAEPPVMADRLNRAEWRDWPTVQQNAVLQFFQAAFDWAIGCHPEEGHDASLWACGLAVLGDSSIGLFDRWLSSPSPNAALQLASFIISEAKHLRRHNEVRGPFWDDVGAPTRRELAKYLMSDRSRAFIQSATANVSDDDRFMFLDAAVAELQRQD